MNLGVRDVRDHDHEWRQVRTVDHDDLGGRTVVETCRWDGCEAHRARWEDTPDQTTLADVGAGGPR
jgi:hypothetical protein